MPDAPVIDLQAIDNLRSLNPGDNDEFLREIVAIFIEDTPLRIADLETGLATSDTAKFTRAAHSIKGSSANLGAAALGTLAEKLEHQSRKEGLTGVAPLLALLSSEFQRTKAELTKLITAK